MTKNSRRMRFTKKGVSKRRKHRIKKYTRKKSGGFDWFPNKNPYNNKFMKSITSYLNKNRRYIQLDDTWMHDMIEFIPNETGADQGRILCTDKCCSNVADGFNLYIKSVIQKNKNLIDENKLKLSENIPLTLKKDIQDQIDMLVYKTEELKQLIDASDEYTEKCFFS